MRIELPPASWTDPASRAEDDAHTLTVAVQPAHDWVQWHGLADPPASVRTQVALPQSRTLTLTL